MDRLIVNNRVQYIDRTKILTTPYLPHQNTMVSITSTLQPIYEHKDKVNDLLTGPFPILTTPKSFDVPDLILQPEYDIYESLKKKHVMTLQMERQQLVSDSVNNLPSSDAVVNDPRYAVVMTHPSSKMTSFCL
jgi:hypothetical protein